MSRARKVLTVILVALGVIIVVLFAVVRWFTTQAFPQTRGTVELAGISAPVEILRDEYGVAHIYADNAIDLFYGQGYVEAQERFWQMEFQRRAAAGRLSEIFGEATLDIDRFIRHYNFPGLAQQDYENLDPESKKVIDAYVAGVNAYIHHRSPAELGLEFAILNLQGANIEVEPWTPVSSLSWVYMMVMDQSSLGGVMPEIREADLLNSIGPERYAELRPDYRADRPVIIPTEELVNMGLPTVASQPAKAELWFSPSSSGSLTTQAGKIQSPLAMIGLGLNGGSNSFAFSGAMTSTGMPILANDTHMLIQAPSLFYEIGLYCREKSDECPYELRGFSLPAIPAILIGHNDRIAWGLTNASFDAEDVFIEKINPEDPNQYEVNGQWVTMDSRQEEIWVNGQEEPEVITIRETRHGVVASDFIVDVDDFNLGDDLPEPFALVYAATALSPIDSARAVFRVNKAQNWDEFVDALSTFDAGKQNWIYADVDGNIGLVTPGLIPIRAAGDSTLPVPGWNDDYAWTGFIPYDEMPRTFNPEKGFIITANQPQVRAENYPYYLGNRQNRGQRAEQINRRVAAHEGTISIEDVMAFQSDNGSVSAGEVIPYLENLVLEEPTSSARDRLLSWDRRMEMESSEAVIYNYFWREFLAQAFQDQLPERHWLTGSTVDADAVYHLLKQPDSVWWDDTGTAGVEDRDTILAQSFEDGFAQAVADLGENIDDWRWGELHTIVFDHPTLGQTGISLIDNIFNSGPHETGGSALVPQNTAWVASGDSFEVVSIPHIREVIDLGDLSNSWMMHQLGQGGRPMHAHYENFVDKWRFFEYIPNHWLAEGVEEGRSDLLLLTPAP